MWVNKITDVVSPLPVPDTAFAIAALRIIMKGMENKNPDMGLMGRLIAENHKVNCTVTPKMSEAAARALKETMKHRK